MIFQGHTSQGPTYKSSHGMFMSSMVQTSKFGTNSKDLCIVLVGIQIGINIYVHIPPSSWSELSETKTKLQLCQHLSLEAVPCESRSYRWHVGSRKAENLHTSIENFTPSKSLSNETQKKKKTLK
jgi:hypothetical protein